LRRCVSRVGRSPTLWAVLLACSVASPATEIREALAHAAPLEVAAGDARIGVARASFADVAVSLDGARALVVAVVDADGRVRTGGRDVRLSYLGREALEMERCPGRRWCSVGPALPALGGVVEALLAARSAPGRTPVAWQIRVERDRATVGEDAEGAQRVVLELVREVGGWRVVE
jgi:hypothetical protein